MQVLEPLLLELRLLKSSIIASQVDQQQLNKLDGLMGQVGTVHPGECSATDLSEGPRYVGMLFLAFDAIAAECVCSALLLGLAPASLGRGLAL